MRTRSSPPGPGIERWLERPIATVATSAEILRLDQVDGLTRLEIRDDEARSAAMSDTRMKYGGVKRH